MTIEMKPRKKQPTLTRQAILDAAGTQFSLHGYAGTSLGSIVSLSGLTKGAMFHHFSDKRTLSVAWVEHSLTLAMGALWFSPLDAVNSLDALLTLSRARCMELSAADATSALVSMSAETAAVDSVLGPALESVFSKWRAALVAVLERGKSNGWIHRSIDPNAEAAFFVAAFSGFTVTTKCNPGDASKRACASSLASYLETLRAE